MPDFRLFGIASAALIVTAVFLAANRKFKYHKIAAVSGVLFMLIHIAGSFGLY